MTVIIFLIDTSASMMQKSYLGTTLLDFARLTVEQFLKQRQRDPASSGDRYMLMTFEEYPYNIKSGWKESQRVFNEQLKGLRAKGVANFEQSVESVMRLLTINRMQTGVGAGIENYGFGRFPSYTEHVVIVPVVDGSELPTDDPAANVPKPRLLVGNDFTTEAFRWDQRMFPIVLRLAGHQRLAATAPSSSTASTTAAGVGTPQQQQMVPLPDRSIAESFATQMGGRSFAITSHRTLFLCIDTIMQRIQFNGVFVWFRKHGQDPSPPPLPITATSTEDAQQLQQKDETVKDNSPTLGATGDAAAVGDDCWTNTLVLVKAKPGSGPSFWPIPEAFWPDTVRNSLPARPAHPVVLFHCERAEPMFNPEFPLDKYELDSSTPLVQFMLSRREPNLCWQVFVEGSFKQPGVGLPFGYLKVSSASTVNLLVMPYNYPDLLTLLAQAKEGAKMIASVPFQQRFDKYLNTVPPYYYTYLKKQLNRLKIAPPSLEEANTKLYGYINMGTHHAKMKQQGLQEFELACMAVQKCLSDPTNINAAVFGANPAAFVKLSRARALLGKAMPLTADCAPSFRPALGFLPSLQPQLLPPTGPDLTIFVPYAAGGAAGGGAIIQSSASTSAVPPSQLFKNPFDIPRANLCAQLDKMRINFEQQVRGGNGGGGCNDLHVFQGGPPGQKIKLQHAEDLANLPISKMGVYEDYVKSLIAIGMGPKRELEPQAARPHAFGNPFKLDKKSNMYIADEVGEMNAGASTSAPSDGPFSSTSNGGGSGRRRRAGSEAGTLATGVRPPRRRPGPIDPNRLEMWRRRRRSSSVISCPEEATTASPSSIEIAATNPSFDAYEERAPLRMVEEEEDDETDRTSFGLELTPPVLSAGGGPMAGGRGCDLFRQTLTPVPALKNRSTQKWHIYVANI
uniref:VWFA domain-containing protein n=1 Tax=Globodera pallida TaxID=36090 RepID=A0A183BSP9_GLOPA